MYLFSVFEHRPIFFLQVDHVFISYGTEILCSQIPGMNIQGFLSLFGKPFSHEQKSKNKGANLY